MTKTIMNKNGFTLLEVLVAIMLLAVGVMSVSGMQTVAMSGNQFAKDTSIMVKLAEEMVDRIRTNGGGDATELMKYHSMNTQTGCNTLSDPAKGDCEQWEARLEGRDFGILRSHGEVTVTRDSPIANTATVNVTVVWGSSNWLGTARSITLTTVINTWG